MKWWDLEKEMLLWGLFSSLQRDFRGKGKKTLSLHDKKVGETLWV